MLVSGADEVVDENRRMIEWMAIEGNLAPKDLREMMPNEEWRGLTLLVSVLHSSKACTSIEEGRIVASYDNEVEVVLHFESMLRRRIDWLCASSERHQLAKPDCHLHVIVRRRWSESGQIMHPRKRDRWSIGACIAATEAEDLPVTDLAATFVLWADSGFPKAPATLIEQISFVKGPDSYEDFIEEKRRLERDSVLRAENRRRAARLEIMRRHEEEEESRLLQEAADRFGMMGWRQVMEVDRDLEGAPGELNESMRAMSRSILDPEEANL